MPEMRNTLRKSSGCLAGLYPCVRVSGNNACRIAWRRNRVGPKSKIEAWKKYRQQNPRMRYQSAPAFS